MLMESTISTGKAAKLLGVSVKTLQRWEREGRLIPVARTDGNRRLSPETQIRAVIGLRQANHAPTKLVAYCRVSSAAQKKAKRYGTHLIIADRWYPSRRLCSVCGWKNEALTLRDREWVCAECGAHHNRDLNAALNMKRLATVTALPVASPTSNGGAAAGMAPAVVGEVTPVRYDGGHQDTSGQEENRAHFCAHS